MVFWAHKPSGLPLVMTGDKTQNAVLITTISPRCELQQRHCKGRTPPAALWPIGITWRGRAAVEFFLKLPLHRFRQRICGRMAGRICEPVDVAMRITYP
jgi:hypothetical protein